MRINQEINKHYFTMRIQLKKLREKIQKKRMEKQQRTLSSLRDKMSYMEMRLNDTAQEQGSSSWLTVLPINWLGFDLSKLEFLDAVHLNYGLPLKRPPTNCGCRKPYKVQHAISWKKLGFVPLRHEGLKGIIRVFFHNRVFNINAQRHQRKTLRKCYEMNKQEKKNTNHKFWMLNKKRLHHLCFQQLGKKMFDVC